MDSYNSRWNVILYLCVSLLLLYDEEREEVQGDGEDVSTSHRGM